MDNKDNKDKRTYVQVVAGTKPKTKATSTASSTGASTRALAGASARASIGAPVRASAGTSTGTPPLQAWGPFQPPLSRSTKPSEQSTRSASSNKSKEGSSSVPPRYPPQMGYRSIPQRSAFPPIWSPPKGRKITKKEQIKFGHFSFLKNLRNKINKFIKIMICQIILST